MAALVWRALITTAMAGRPLPPREWLARTTAAAACWTCVALTALSPADADVLSGKEVGAKLDAVPVYVVTTKNGAPVLFDTESKGNAQEGRFFTEFDAAEDQVRRIPSRLLKPADVSVRSVPLGFVYLNARVAEETGGPQYRVIPSSAAVREAADIVAKGGSAMRAAMPATKNALNGGVPLFIEPSLLIAGDGGADRFPVFFSAADLRQVYTRASGSAGPAPQIKVTDLDSFVDRLLSDASVDGQSVIFVASSTSLAVADASARVQAERAAAEEAARAPLRPAASLSDAAMSSAPFGRAAGSWGRAPGGLGSLSQ